MEHSKAMQDFLAKGGKVVVVPENQTSDYKLDYNLRDCTCGCNGDYTNHQMRKGERGIL